MSQNLAKEILGNKEFRHYWGEMYLRQNIPFQMKTMRTQRKLNQIEAGELLGKGQNGLSRLESPAYGRLTLQTLLEVARGYDVGLLVKFVPFSRLVREYDDVSFDALAVPSPDRTEFPEEVAALEAWGERLPADSIFEESDNVIRTDRFPSELTRNDVSQQFSLPMLVAVASTHNDEGAVNANTQAIAIMASADDALVASDDLKEINDNALAA